MLSRRWEDEKRKHGTKNNTGFRDIGFNYIGMVLDNNI